MKPIESFELSGYLDGELDSERMREIEVAISRDPTLRREFEELRAMDARWRSSARTAIFGVSVPTAVTHRSPRAIGIALVVLGLVALRLIPKFVDLATIGVVLHVAVLLVTLIWLARTQDELHGQT